MALQQLFYCFSLQTVSNFAVAVVWSLLRETGWRLDYGNGAPDPQRWWWEPRGPWVRLQYFCSSKDGAPWHLQTGLPSPPVLFCSPKHEIISVLFRAGAVNPCELSRCGVAPLNALCLKAQGKKPGLSCVWSQEHCASRTGLSSSFLSLTAASGKLPPSSLVVTSNSAQMPVTCCAGSRSLPSWRTCCAGHWPSSLPPSSKDWRCGSFAHVHL